MPEVENIRDWHGKDVLDPGGAKIGDVDDVYFDIETDEPLFLRVRSGRFRHRIILIPVEHVEASPDHLTTVSMTRATAKKAPAMDPDGELSAELEEALFGYYALSYRPARTPGGRRLVRR